MPPINAFLFLLVMSIFNVLFCEIDSIPEISGNVLEGANIYKCKCGMNEALDSNEDCTPSSNPVLVWDNVEQKHFVTDIANFSSVTLNPVKCKKGYSKLKLSQFQFLIFTNGLLDNLEMYGDFDAPLSSSYCIDQVLEESGISLTAEVCQANPAIPTCCPPGYVSREIGKCHWHGEQIPFNLTLVGNFLWEEYNLTEKRIQCKEGEIVKREPITYPDRIGASLIGYPLGSKVKWISLYNFSPVEYQDYCVAATESAGEWRYYAEFCAPDPKLQHLEMCKNSTCLRKCCPLGYIFDTMYSVCIPEENHLIQYTFIESDGRPMEEIPQITTLVYGFPFCDDSYQLSSDSKERSTLTFTSEGTLITVTSGNYSSLDYCVEGFVYNYTDPNSTIKNDAIVCIKNFEQNCQWRWIISGVLLSISCIFYILTLTIYIAIDELRSKMVGKCLISQVSALLIAYLTLIFLQNVNNYHGMTCNFPGTIEHISILAAFFWLNVLCYDMWSNIKEMKVAKKKTSTTSKKFLLYCVYAWGVPLLIGLLRVIIDLLPERYDSNFLVRSNLGKTHCFFSGHYSASKWLYLYLPILIILLANLGFFIHVAIIIRRTKKESEKMMANSESAKTGEKNLNAKKEKVKFYLKLFFVMGISWLLEIIMWVAVHENDCYFWGLDIVNMLQGIFIFIIFVCKKQTLQLIREKLGNRKKSSTPREDIRLAEEMERTAL